MRKALADGLVSKHVTHTLHGVAHQVTQRESARLGAMLQTDIEPQIDGLIRSSAM
jgi:hypothetical protein